MTREEKTKLKRNYKITRIVFYSSAIIFVTSFISGFLGIGNILPNLNDKFMFVGLFIFLPIIVFFIMSMNLNFYQSKFNIQFEKVKKYRQYLKFHRVIEQIEIGDIDKAISIYNMMYHDENKIYLDAYLTASCINSYDVNYKEKGIKMLKRALDYANPNNIKL